VRRQRKHPTGGNPPASVRFIGAGSRTLLRAANDNARRDAARVVRLAAAAAAITAAILLAAALGL